MTRRRDDQAQPAWQVPAGEVRLSGDEVHVWRTSLDLPDRCVQRLRRTLSTDERARAELLYFPEDRRRLILAHGLLRQILSSYLMVPPEMLHFRRSSNGKPYLDARAETGALRFNLSHSHELALFAVTRDREIGIDCEFLRATVPIDQIVDSFFSQGEKEAFRTIPERMRSEVFFKTWTRKEAFLKATGKGARFPMNDFELSVLPGERATLLSIREKPGEASFWALRDLDPAPGYVGSLTVRGNDWRMLCWEVPESFY